MRSYVTENKTLPNFPSWTSPVRIRSPAPKSSRISSLPPAFCCAKSRDYRRLQERLRRFAWRVVPSGVGRVLGGLLCSLGLDFLSYVVDGGEDFAFDVVQEFLCVGVAGAGGDGDPARVDAFYGVSSVACAAAPAVCVCGLPLCLWLFSESSVAECC